MLNEIFQTRKLHNSGTSDKYIPSNSSVQEWRESDMNLDSFGSRQLFNEPNDISKPGLIISSSHKFNPSSDFGEDYNNLDAAVPPNLSCGNQFKKSVTMNSQDTTKVESEKKARELFLSASFRILKKYGRRCRRLNGEKLNTSVPISREREETLSNGHEQLSVELIIQLASQKFIQSTNSQDNDEISVLSHPYPGSILDQDSEGAVELVQNLLSLAEKIVEKKYSRAFKILQDCEGMVSSKGSPIQRLVFYFIEALYEKIDRETGTISLKGLAKKVEDPIESLKSPNTTLVAYHKEMPISQITTFAGIQAAVDNVADASKVHFIIFELRTGIQCTVLMHALANRCGPPLRQIKITAMGTNERESIEETGRQLMSFAQTLHLDFSFNVVMVDRTYDLNETMFGIENDEAVVIDAAFTLMNMIGEPNELNHLMKVVKTINPRVMIVTEVEANCNNPNFVERFVEALFFYGAFFESLAECFKKDEEQRFLGESTCFRAGIRNIVATEGEERKIRHVSIRVWRAFFKRFGLEEIELSMSSVYQANLVVKNFACGSEFTFDFDGKSLIIGWKGTPMISLSAWKLASFE